MAALREQFEFVFGPFELANMDIDMENSKLKPSIEWKLVPLIGFRKPNVRYIFDGHFSNGSEILF